MKRTVCCVAVLGTMLLAGCQRESLDTPADSNVVFTVELPGDLSTRAISDGLTAKTLHYEVYDESKDVLYYENKMTLEGGKTTVELNLVKNQTYNIVFWAQSDDAECYDNTDLRNIKVSYDKALSNDETRDAFYATVQDLYVTGAHTQRVTLYRPFAQVNFGTTQKDLDAAKLIGGMAPVKSKVTLRGATSLNTFEETVSGYQDVVIFDYHNVPDMAKEELAVDLNKDEAFSDDEKFEYIATNYILVSQNEKETMDVTAEIALTVGEDVVVTAPSVPVQRNWRTNILGDLLTDAAKFYVVIDQNYCGDHNVEPAQVVVVTPDNFDLIDFKQDNAAYTFEGDFTADAYKVFSAEGLTQIYDGSAATFVGQLEVRAGGLLDNSSSLKSEKSGEYTFRNFKAEELSVAAMNTTLNVLDNTLESLDFHAGNITLVIKGNSIDGHNEEHSNVNSFKRKLGVYVYAVDYELTFEDNTVFNTLSAPVCVNGWALNGSDWAAYPAENNVVSFSGNNLTVGEDDGTALYFMGDHTYFKEAGTATFNEPLAALTAASKDANTFAMTNSVEAAWKYGATEIAAWDNHKTEAIDFVVASTAQVSTVTEFVKALEAAGDAGAGNSLISLTADLDFSGIDWKPLSVDGYNGADIVTLNGNGHIITNLSAPLFAGGFAGGSGIVIKDLTITDSEIVSVNTLGSGAFIESVDSMDEITLTNCHLKNSTVTGGNDSRTGGLIGWTAGYNNVSDGPVKTYVTIMDCSVIGCEITCNGSVGGIYGHAGNNAWTFSTVKDCIVKDCILNSTDDGNWRCGVVVGTANVGELTISNITESGNTLLQTGKTAPEGQSNLYGRFVPGETGKLVIDGIEIK